MASRRPKSNLKAISEIYDLKTLIYIKLYVYTELSIFASTRSKGNFEAVSEISDPKYLGFDIQPAIYRIIDFGHHLEVTEAILWPL